MSKPPIKGETIEGVTIVGNALALPNRWTGTFTVVATSPCYGNRMADHHVNEDACSLCKGTGKGDATATIGVKHPAKFSDEILQTIARIIDERHPRRSFVLDPFAGVGRVHELSELCKSDVETLGVEIEPEWARALDSTPTTRRGVCKKCKGTGRSVRRSYTHDLGHELHADNSGKLQWGDEYRNLHERAWEEVHRVLQTRGTFILNVKDHERQGERQHVSAWHRRTIESIGFERVETWTLDHNGMRFGENHEARTDSEYIYVFEKKGRP